MAAKQTANAQRTRRIWAKISGGRPPSCHASTDEKRRKIPTWNPAAKNRSLSAAEPAHVKVDRTHGGKHRVYSPRGIGLPKAERVSDGKEQQKNTGDAVEHRRFHVPLQKSWEVCSRGRTKECWTYSLLTTCAAA